MKTSITNAKIKKIKFQKKFLERQPRFRRLQKKGTPALPAAHKGGQKRRRGSRRPKRAQYQTRQEQSGPNIKSRGQKPPQEHRKRAQGTGRQEQTGGAAGAAACALYLIYGPKIAGLYNIIKRAYKYINI